MALQQQYTNTYTYTKTEGDSLIFVEPKNIPCRIYPSVMGKATREENEDAKGSPKNHGLFFINELSMRSTWANEYNITPNRIGYKKKTINTPSFE